MNKSYKKRDLWESLVRQRVDEFMNGAKTTFETHGGDFATIKDAALKYHSDNAATMGDTMRKSEKLSLWTFGYLFGKVLAGRSQDVHMSDLASYIPHMQTFCESPALTLYEVQYTLILRVSSSVNVLADSPTDAIERFNDVPLPLNKKNIGAHLPEQYSLDAIELYGDQHVIDPQGKAHTY